MTRKDGHDAIHAWLKSEIDDYQALKSRLNGEIDRIRPARSVQTLDLDRPAEALPAHSKAGLTGFTIASAARIAIPEIARNQEFRLKRCNDYENAVAAFHAWSGGAHDLADITPELVAEFKNDLTYYPARGSVRPAYRDMH